MLWQDLRYGFRMMGRSPGFTALAVLSLALGIGANTAIFTLLDQLLLRALPVENPEQLVIFEGGSYPFYTDLRDRNKVLSGLIAYDTRTAFSLSNGRETERIFGLIVSGNFFSVLGVKAAFGRTFLPEEDRTPGTHPVAVLNHGLWQRRFGADPQLVGKDIKLNGLSFTVIGIAPAEFTGIVRGTTPELYVPTMMQQQAQPGRGSKLASRNDGWLGLMGRLNPGVSREQAQAHLTALAAEIKQAYPRTVDPERVALADGSQGNTDRIRELSLPLRVLMIVVGFVLLIACANVANLLIARAEVRRKEIAVRLAVGASRQHVIRQLLTESVLLSLLGGIAGLLIATWLADFFISFRPATSFMPLELDGRFDLRILGFAFLLSCLTGIVFGLAPAFQAARADLVSSLKDDAASKQWSSRRWTLRNLLVVSQVALSLIVLIGAALCIRSLQKLQHVDAGFEPAKVLVMSMDLNLAGYDESRGRQLFPQLIEGISALPGVENASLAFIVPLQDMRITRSAQIENYEPQPNEQMSFSYNAVGSGYFQTMGISLLHGREFTPQDTTGAAPVAIVNDRLARRYFPGQDPIGKRMQIGSGRGLSEIVGVVRDSSYRSLTEGVRPTMYVPLLQHYTSFVSLHVRTAGDPKALLAAVRRETQSLDPSLPVYNLKTLEEQKDGSLYKERLVAALLTGFGLLTLVLTSVGLYGVIAFAVGRRTREIGIRMAIGARHQDVLSLVLYEGMILVGAGLVLGLGASVAATRLLSSFLYGVSATDTWSFVASGAILTLVALAASFIPAWRAARVDPMVALRYE